jgi:hypothetical protein
MSTTLQTQNDPAALAGAPGLGPLDILESTK